MGLWRGGRRLAIGWRRRGGGGGVFLRCELGVGSEKLGVGSDGSGVMGWDGMGWLEG